MSPTFRVSLAAAEAGCEVKVCVVGGRDGHAQRLRELGLLEGKTIRIVSNRDPLICQVGECRLGVCRRLAQAILVEPVATPLARSA